MRKKIISAVLLILFTSAILVFFGGGHFNGDPAYLFRCNVVNMGEVTSRKDAYADYGETRNFSHQQERLLNEGVIPELAEYPGFSCEVLYSANGEVAAVYMNWENFQTAKRTRYKWVKVMILADRTQDTAAWTDVFVPVWYQTTRTNVEGIMVYGSGTPWPYDDNVTSAYHNDLVFEKGNLRYQISCITDDTLDGMLELLEHYIRNDFALDVVSLEKGDIITSESLPEGQ